MGRLVDAQLSHVPEYEVIPHFPREALSPLVPLWPSSPLMLFLLFLLALPYWPLVPLLCHTGSCLRAFARDVSLLWAFLPPVAHVACFLTAFTSVLKCHLPVRPFLISLFKTDPQPRHTLYPHFLLYFLYNTEHHLTLFIWFISCFSPL